MGLCYVGFVLCVRVNSIVIYNDVCIIHYGYVWVIFESVIVNAVVSGLW